MSLFMELFGEAIANVLYLAVLFGSAIVFGSISEHMTIKEYIEWMSQDEED